MTKEEILNDIEILVMDFDNNIENIKNKLSGITIDKNLGQQLIYADILSKSCRQRRMLLFDIMLHESSNLKTDWITSYYLLKEAYIMTDNIYAQLKLSPYSFNLKDYLREMQTHVNIEQLMNQEEREYLNALAFPMKVYRGMCNTEAGSNDYGISWCDSQEYASKYVFFSKNNNKDKDGKIASCMIKRSDVFGRRGIFPWMTPQPNQISYCNGTDIV